MRDENSRCIWFIYKWVPKVKKIKSGIELTPIKTPVYHKINNTLPEELISWFRQTHAVWKRGLIHNNKSYLAKGLSFN